MNKTIVIVLIILVIVIATFVGGYAYYKSRSHKESLGGGRGGGGMGRGGGRGGGGMGRGGFPSGPHRPPGPWNWNWPWNQRRPWSGPYWPWSIDQPYYYPELPVYPYVYRDPVIPVERYAVRIGPKTKDHPFYSQGSKLGFMISKGDTPVGCGVSGARLDLEYGRTYEFQVYTDKDCFTGQPRDQPFFFTSDPEGGAADGALFNVLPTTDGIVRVTMTNDLPPKFYYQSTEDKKVGGYVFLKHY